MNARGSTPKLGRGLAALLGDIGSASDAGSTGAVQAIPLDLLEPGPFQPRGEMSKDALQDLTGSIRAKGILQPLLVRPHPGTPGRYQIIAGERRWRAAQAAGLHEAPALIRALPDGDAMAAALVENLQRLDLNAIEEAEGYQRLIHEFRMKHELLSQVVGKSRSHVTNTLRLLNLPPAVQREVRRGTLTAGHARALLAHPEPARAALSVIAQGLNVRQTEAFAMRAGTPPQAPERARGDPETRALEHSLSEHLGLRIRITRRGKGGSVRIDYASLDQLEAVIALLDRR